MFDSLRWVEYAGHREIALIRELLSIIMEPFKIVDASGKTKKMPRKVQVDLHLVQEKDGKLLAGGVVRVGALSAEIPTTEITEESPQRAPMLSILGAARSFLENQL